MQIHHISADHLTVEQAYTIVTSGMHIALSDDARQRILHCREYLDKKIAESEVPIYGVTTGFGSLCKVSIDDDKLSQLQINLMMSHACGTGERVRKDIVRLMLLLKVQSLSYGFSGCQLATVERLIDFFNNGVCPIVYQQGSVGASGDLVPLAHLCLPLVGMGEVEYQGEVISGAELNKKMGWEPIRLASKEGLALLNGTQNMSAHAVWCMAKANRLSRWADLIGTLSLEAFDGRKEPFTDAVHQVRPHRGQIETAERIRTLLEGSELIAQPKVNVQDPYSFRCMPQVHGAVKDSMRYVESVIDTEINSATDNPTVCPDDDLIISAGNFHGEPIALPMDFLCLALNELGAISERRTYKLVGGTRNLPSFLAAHPGLNSGFMIPQYTAAAIASQNKMLCMPASADTIPTSQGQEDHVSMGANAATKLVKVVENTERILAIELFNATQALDFRRPLKSSPAIEKLHADFRKVVPFVENDEVMYPHIAHAVEFLQQQEA
ncbi:MAG: histidine ammonia-lyase [Bacteroidaceae bacterium]|nr:histidine ammonia-lyase [Bacteroidaceae bacterium]